MQTGQGLYGQAQNVGGGLQKSTKASWTGNVRTGAERGPRCISTRNGSW